MRPRVRRAVALVLILVLALVVGRGVVGFLADRWWAAAISPEAASAVGRWQWLGLLLDVGAVVIASGWFALHAVVVARSIATVQVQHRVGGLAVRELVPTRLLVLGAIACGVLLGVLTGIGASAWRDAVALAWRGVHFGIVDPVLGVDIGVFIARLPAWELAHEFAIMLVALGLALIVALYVSIGAIAVGGRRVTLHPYARRHLGLMLAVVAVIVAWGYTLTPYHLAITQAGWLALTALETRIVAAHLMVGLSLGVALLTVRWAFVGRPTLLVASWGVLAVSIAVERTIVPVFVAGELAQGEQAEYATRLGDRLYGINRQGPAPPAPGPEIHDLWDRGMLYRYLAGAGAPPLLAVPSTDGPAGWLAVSQLPGEGGGLQIHRFAADSVSVDGAPVPLGSPQVVQGAPLVPGKSGWAIRAAAVRAGNVGRRAVIAWARQAPGILRLGSGASIDWHLDPLERATRLIPTVTWQLVGMATGTGEARWVLSGFALAGGVPHGIESRFGDVEVNGVAPALIAAVGTQTGSVEVWSDPAADSLGAAIASLHRPLVRTSGPIPDEIVAALGYPVDWFRAQLAALDPRGGVREGDSHLPNALSIRGKAGVQVLLDDPASAETVTLIAASRSAGLPIVEWSQVKAALPTTIGVVSDGWRASAGFSQVYDSVRASGDTLLSGPLRWSDGANGLSVWRTYSSAGARGPARLLWLGVATRRGIEGNRPGAVQWGTASDSTGGPSVTPQFRDLARLEAARSWLIRADSALARGDLTAFGRAWEALRGVLSDSGRQ